jgi:two-component system, cell cycle sensor histidine kinase and response regulator CckA
MKDERKTKAQLIRELVEMRHRVAELEGADSLGASTVQDIADRMRIEEDLRESERILDATGKLSRIGGWEHDLTTGRAVWTRALYDIIELPHDQDPPGVDGHLGYYPVEYREQLVQAYNTAVAEGTPFDIELLGRTARGNEIWCRVQGEAVLEGGKCVRMRGTFQDITAQKQSEQAARFERTRAQQYLDIAGVMLLAIGTDQRVTLVNRKGCDILGYAEEEILGQNWFERFLPEEQVAEVSSVFDQILCGNVVPVEYHENPIVRRDGSRRLIAWHNSILRDSEGKIAGLFSSGMDITVQRRTEEALRESERVHRRAVESLGGAVYRMAPEVDKYDSMSESFQGMTGYSSREVTPEFVKSIILERRMLGPLAGLTREEALRAVRMGDAPAWRTEIRIRTKSGRERWLADTAVVATGEGSRESAYGILIDITDHKRLEEEVARIHNLESLGTLAGGIAHDFNNMLTGVTGNLALLARLLQKESEEHQLAREALDSAIRTKGLTQQLMTFAGGGAPVKEAASIESLIRETTALSLRGANTKAAFALAEDLRSVNVDPGQIGQVIQNLVLNADQATPNGGTLHILADNVVISAGDALPLEPGAYVRIEVRDEGVGIPDRILHQVFDPYFTTKEAGHGLGLAICHSIIQRHGGHISVESERGEGTAFTFYLPAAKARAVEVTQEALELPEGTGRILVMDDEDQILRTVGRMLGALGYTAAAAKNGEEAISAYRQASASGDPFGLVIMDLTIPGGMGGKEAVVKLHEVDPQARVIVASGYADDPVMADPQAYGFVAGIRKPIDLDELAEVVAQAIG